MSGDSAIVAEEDDGIRLDRWFKRHRPGTPHALIARWARSGELTIDGRKADVSDRIEAGQTIAMPVPPAAPSGPRPRKEKALSPADIALAEAMVIHRDKSALVKKEMRLFRPLVGDDLDAPALLQAALALASHRVVVKRPRKAPIIEGAKPSYALEGKSSRYDIYPRKALKPQG